MGGTMHDLCLDAPQVALLVVACMSVTDGYELGLLTSAYDQGPPAVTHPHTLGFKCE